MPTTIIQPINFTEKEHLKKCQVIQNGIISSVKKKLLML